MEISIEAGNTNIWYYMKAPPDQRHAETRVVDISVARHQNHIARIPAERFHLRARHRQKLRGTKALGPVLTVRKEIARGVHRVGEKKGAQV